MERHAKHAKKLQKGKIKTKNGKKRDHKKGVKGKSIITGFPRTRASSAFVPEIMHSIFLGIGEQPMYYLFNKKGSWSLKKFIKNINSRLKGIRPPATFPRKPRSVLEHGIYKATEFYDFLIFYSIPILKNYFSHEYFQHWLSLIIPLHLLLQSSMDVEKDLPVAEYLLEDFVKNFETFYDKSGLSYNMHQILHLPLYAARFGLLWASTASNTGTV